MSRILANIVVYANWFLFALNTIFYIGVFVASIISFDDVAKYLQNYVKDELGKPVVEDLESARSALTIFLAIFGIIGGGFLVIYCALNVLLTKGVHQSDNQKCNRWIIINSIFFLMKLLSMLYSLIVSQQMMYVLPNVIYLILYGTSLFIIKKFSDNLLIDTPGNFSYKNFGYVRTV